MDLLPTEINIVTLNCWGLRFVSKWRSERILEIGRRLSTTAPGIVALQEVWSEEDYEILRRETRAVLPYGKQYHAGVFGSGLVILSRWPLEESSMFQFPLNGRPTAFFRGDWYAGKGVAHARIRYGPQKSQVIEVFNIHTHAAYETEAKDSYAAHRASQAWFFAKLLRSASERGHLVVGLGDLNAPPFSLPHRLVTAQAPVRDAWRVLYHSHLDDEAPEDPNRHRRQPPTADFNLRQNGVTSDSVFNTWRWDSKRQKRLGPPMGGKVITRKASRHLSLVEVSDLRPEQPLRTARWQEDNGVPSDAPDPKGKRIDYVFAGTGDPALIGGVWTVRNAKVGMVERHSELGCSLSDHFSVEVTLKFHPTMMPTGPEPPTPRTVPLPPDESEKSRPVPPQTPLSPVANKKFTPRASAMSFQEAVKEKMREQEKTRQDTEVATSTDGATILVERGTYLSSPAPSLSDINDENGEGDDQYEHHEQQQQQLARTNTLAGSIMTLGGARRESAHGLAVPPALYDEVLALTRACASREEKQQLWRAFHFFAGALVWVACLVAVWFVPPGLTYVTFILILVGGLSLAAGTVDGLISLLFLSSELRSLRELEWEVMNARSAAAAIVVPSTATRAAAAAAGVGRLTDRSHAISTTTATTSINKNW
ncbi:hypothetical protein MCOR27_008803 [Pyricularia oryzae]|uniref:Endonuclease/exonuclease/phosphatase domain-containing protein n=1 Tax=Pyricularia oryzae TaxID=318829 RepID=A0A4P7NMZ6_PYROR|nr:hypothetical protein MCOR01_002075 [Pyricularia oryzae]KAI6263780.1 hypothetical protein MCOR19_000110 [Pyricularia oryzae]KAI6271467.1 hypothetical protein MCOR27_008803 [Pyricularia oryzae]KAI6288136.1 hypothetical protein MCOR26_000146 [Pyricularia oryzae]KAI6318736.1 hypothetical protein MCOR30_008844 [Pyricularia oryzae]